MPQEMVKKVIAGLCVGVFFMIAYAPMPQNAPNTSASDLYDKTLSQYNKQRYLEYLGPEPEPFEVTYIEPVEEPRFTDAEIDLMARVVMSEVGIESFEVKQALAETIINRLESDYKEFRYQDTLDKVIVPGQFSTSDNGDPTDDCYKAVYAAIEYNAFPDDMLWARARYVSYGHEYTVDKNSVTKFSTVTNYNEVIE